MALVPATNYNNPSFQKSDDLDDLVDERTIQNLGQAVDAHDHAADNGLPVKRVQYGTLAGQPAAGNAGHIYIATDTQQLFIDDGAVWVAISADALVTETDIQDGSVTTLKLAVGVLSADVPGRARMADLYLTTAKLADGVLSADAAGRAKMANGFILDAQVGAAAAIASSKLADLGANFEPLRSPAATALSHVEYAEFTGGMDSGATVEHDFVFNRAFSAAPVVTFGYEAQKADGNPPSMGIYVKWGVRDANHVVVQIKNINNLMWVDYDLMVMAVGPSA